MFEQYNPSEETSVQEDNVELQNQAKKGANWFYWIAGASLVNTVIFLFNGNLSFIIGLGITQIVSGIALAIEDQSGPSMTPKIGAFLINLAISAVFIAIGYFAGKGMIWAFIVGIVFYILDGLIFFLFGDLWSIGFHVFALFFIVRGLLTANKLRKIEPPIMAQ